MRDARYRKTQANEAILNLFYWVTEFGDRDRKKSCGSAPQQWAVSHGNDVGKSLSAERRSAANVASALRRILPATRPDGPLRARNRDKVFLMAICER